MSDKWVGHRSPLERQRAAYREMVEIDRILCFDREPVALPPVHKEDSKHG